MYYIILSSQQKNHIYRFSIFPCLLKKFCVGNALESGLSLLGNRKVLSDRQGLKEQSLLNWQTSHSPDPTNYRIFLEVTQPRTQPEDTNMASNCLSTPAQVGEDCWNCTSERFYSDSDIPIVQTSSNFKQVNYPSMPQSKCPPHLSSSLGCGEEQISSGTSFLKGSPIIIIVIQMQ